MGLIDWITDGHYCKGCGDFFPKSVLITFSGHGTYCTCCAREIIEDEMEE